jgi:hypothetical protein
VLCEIIPIDIKSASNDSLKCIVFKIGKADPNAKKNTETQGVNNADTEAVLALDNVDYY